MEEIVALASRLSRFPEGERECLSPCVKHESRTSWRRAGCIACGFLGCDSNPERRDFFADDDDGDGSATPFNRDAANAALATLVPSMCKRPGAPTGSGHAKVTFHPSGAVVDVKLDGGLPDGQVNRQ